MRLLNRLLFTSMLLISPLALAEDSAPTPEPDVTIRQEADKTVTEYRINGMLYAIKVTPRVGPTYYLHRADGSDLWVHSSRPEMLIPAWRIFSW